MFKGRIKGHPLTPGVKKHLQIISEGVLTEYDSSYFFNIQAPAFLSFNTSSCTLA